jgi:hypothetical protein
LVAPNKFTGTQAGGSIGTALPRHDVLRRKLAAGRARLQDKGGLGGYVSHDEGVGVLVVVQRSRPVTAKAERSQADCSDLQGKAEHGPHAGLDGRRRKGQPSEWAGTDQVRLNYGPVLAEGVNARSLVEGVLQLLDEVAHLVGGAQRALGRVVRHEHYAGAAHAGHIGADLAQPLGPERVISGAY